LRHVLTGAAPVGRDLLGVSAGWLRWRMRSGGAGALRATPEGQAAVVRDIHSETLNRVYR